MLGVCGGVSWQGHLCGAIAGIVAAYLLSAPEREAGRRGGRHRCAAASMSSHWRPSGSSTPASGGLTVARAIIDQLPDEDIIYVGDTGNGPYGPLTIPEIRAHALAIGDDLVDRGVKALVIACNTASSACLRDARERYDVPVVEVILPAVRRAVATTRNGRIGVIGTQATIASRRLPGRVRRRPRHRDHRGGLPAIRRLRRARHHQRPSGARPGRGLPRAAAARRRRHPGARLYALPAALRAHPAGDGRQRSRWSPARRKPPKKCFGCLPRRICCAASGWSHNPAASQGVRSHRRSRGIHRTAADSSAPRSPASNPLVGCPLTTIGEVSHCITEAILSPRPIGVGTVVSIRITVLDARGRRGPGLAASGSLLRAPDARLGHRLQQAYSRSATEVPQSSSVHVLSRTFTPTTAWTFPVNFVWHHYHPTCPPARRCCGPGHLVAPGRGVVTLRWGVDDCRTFSTCGIR